MESKSRNNMDRAEAGKSKSLFGRSWFRGQAVGLAPFLLGAALLPAVAQTVAKPPVKTPSAGGNSFAGPGDVRYQPSRDVQDRRIDMFIGDWRDSMPRHAYGSLVLRDILTRGDNF